MMNFLLKRNLCFLLVLFLFLGCSLKVKKKSPPPLEEIINKLFTRRDNFQDIRARVKITLSKEGRKQSFLANLIFDSANRYRIEGLGFLNLPFFFLVDNGRQICLYFLEEGKLYKGKSSEENLFHLSGIKLKSQDLIAFFTGNLPYDLISSSKRKVISEDGKKMVVEFRPSDDFFYKVWIDKNKGVIIKIELQRADQKLHLLATFKEYRIIEGFNWPKHIECNFSESQIKLKIKYKQIFLNSSITEDIFILKNLPANLQVIDL